MFRDVKIELYTRSDEVCVRRQILDVLEEVGIDELKVNVWPKRVRISDSRTWSELKKFNEFSEWAEKNNMELEPHFKKCNYEKKSSKKEYEEIIFPVASIGLYYKDELIFVYPSSKGDKIYTIGDCISVLKDNEIPEKLKKFDQIESIV